MKMKWKPRSRACSSIMACTPSMPLQAMLSFMSTMSQLKFVAHSQTELTLSQPPTAM